MKQIIFIILITLCSTIPSYARVGLADWSDTTPCGNEINNHLAKTLYMKNGTSLEDISKWYFFKKHVIGTIKSYNSEKKGYNKERYFVVNEKSFNIKTFGTEAEWCSYLKEHRLQPILWTRWYSGPWSFLYILILLSILYFFISIPLLLVFIRSLYLAIRREKFNLSKTHTRVTLTIISIIFLIITINYMPQSI